MSQKTMSILKECAPVFSMLQDENRQKILMQLLDYGEMNVLEITDRMELSRPAVSHHLKLLLNAGIVSSRKEGKENYYKVELEEAVALVRTLLESLEADMKKEKAT